MFACVLCVPYKLHLFTTSWLFHDPVFWIKMVLSVPGLQT